jgi:hypothetical protein
MRGGVKCMQRQHSPVPRRENNEDLKAKMVL